MGSAGHVSWEVVEFRGIGTVDQKVIFGRMESAFVVGGTLGNWGRGKSQSKVCAVQSSSTAEGDAKTTLLDLTRKNVRFRGTKIGSDEKGVAMQLIREIEAENGSWEKNLPVVNAMWRLLFTAREGNPSIIQRAVVGSDVSNVFQKIAIKPDGTGRFSNIANFPNAFIPGRLTVEAKILEVENSKLKIRFDNAHFLFNRKYRVPYPVPFRLLGKKAEGWLEISYVHDDMRISRGSRGTVFVFEKLESDEIPE